MLLLLVFLGPVLVPGLCRAAASQPARALLPTGPWLAELCQAPTALPLLPLCHHPHTLSLCSLRYISVFTAGLIYHRAGCMFVHCLGNDFMKNRYWWQLSKQKQYWPFHHHMNHSDISDIITGFHYNLIILIEVWTDFVSIQRNPVFVPALQTSQSALR